MTTKRLPRPRDPIQLAKLIGDIATGQVQDRVDQDKTPSRKAEPLKKLRASSKPRRAHATAGLKPR
jgi:hypothetical protein